MTGFGLFHSIGAEEGAIVHASWITGCNLCAIFEDKLTLANILQTQRVESWMDLEVVVA